MKKFIYWLIKTKYFLDYANQEATGTTIKNVSLAAMRNFPLPLPPLAEPKRIVSAIEKFMPLIEEYGKKETELKALNEQIDTLTNELFTFWIAKSYFFPSPETQVSSLQFLRYKCIKLQCRPKTCANLQTKKSRTRESLQSVLSPFLTC